MVSTIRNRALNRIPAGIKFEQSTPLENQVGGLSHRQVLKVAPIYILKPLHADHRGVREVAFYEFVKHAVEQSFGSTPNHLCPKTFRSRQNSQYDKPISEMEMLRLHREVELLRRLSSFLPFYYGIFGGDNSSPISHSYLVLEDVTNRFQKPCVMDLKVGTQTYEPDADPAKILREKNKYPLQSVFGVRIVGMRLNYPTFEGWHHKIYDKHFGFSLESHESLVSAFGMFLGKDCNRIAIEFIDQLKGILEWFKVNDAFYFISSSLLLVYERDSDNRLTSIPSKPIIRMIDLAHVRAKNELDMGYLTGLQTLENILLHFAVNSGLCIFNDIPN